MRKVAQKSTFAIGGVSCSADSLLVAGSFVLCIKIIIKNPAHHKSVKRHAQYKETQLLPTIFLITLP